LAMIALPALPGVCGDWSPRLAAEYLDSRQKEWLAWPVAKVPGGICISCHTGLTYLLARPSLRQALGESQLTAYEKELLESLRARVNKSEAKELFPTFSREPKASQSVGVEAIFAALFLGSEPEAQRALDRLWTLQIRDGKAKGSWAWFELDLEPWETPDSPFYGATLAALAVGSTSTEYRERQEIRERVTALTDYLQREQANQPVHNRLMQLWASTKLPRAMAESARRSLVDEVLKSQEHDGGWTIESLGPWKKHAQASSSPVSNTYATGFVAFVLQRAGVGQSNPGVRRAVEWLKSHQDPQSGSWAADSMNKKYEPDSMQARFMRDAATAFATLALLEQEEKK